MPTTTQSFARRSVAALVVLALTACSSSDDDNESTDEGSASAASVSESTSAEASSSTEPSSATSETASESDDDNNGGDNGGNDADEAADAAVRGLQALLDSDAESVYELLTDECRATTDLEQVEVGIGVLTGFLEAAGIDPGDLGIEVVESTVEGDNAIVMLQLTGSPLLAESELDEASDFPMVRDGDRWAIDDCEFVTEEEASEIDFEEPSDIDAELAAAGLAGTLDEPIAAGTGAPVGSGLWVSVDAVDPDAGARLTADPNSFLNEIEAGSKYVVITLTVANVNATATDEIPTATSVFIEAIGGTNRVAIDTFGCGTIPNELFGSNNELFVGGVTSGDVCAPVPESEIDGMMLSIESGFSGRAVIFDPFAQAATPTPLEPRVGPQDGAPFTEQRRSPNPIGEAVDVGEGWTVSVNSFTPDATAQIAALNEFNEPPPAGYVYSLVDVTMSYDGEEQSGSPSSVQLGLVGDSNVGSGASCFLDIGPGELDLFVDVFQGGTVSGTVCFVTPAADADSMVLFARGSFFDSEYQFFAVR